MQELTRIFGLPRKLTTALVAAMALALVPIMPAGAVTPPVTATCKGVPATIVGTSGSDWLMGTDGDDVILGLGGPDTIDGKGGNDLICGSGGNDTIEGGEGNDRIFGGVGDDTISGGLGNDRLFGQRGKDKIAGVNGRDRLRGGGGDDTLAGGLGPDRVSCGSGFDFQLGLMGIDDAEDVGNGCSVWGEFPAKIIRVNPVGNGYDPTDSNFGDPYFAGTMAMGETVEGIPMSAKKLTGKAPFRMRVPSEGQISLDKDFDPYTFAGGATVLDHSTTSPVTVEMFCCAVV